MQHDLAAPERWLVSQRRSTSRRLAAARAATRRRLGRRGGVVLVAAMALGTGGAVAAQGGGSPVAAARPAAPTVTAIQKALGITADGIAGPQTRRAIKRFQRAQGLTVDGIAGPATLAALGVTPPAETESDSRTDAPAPALTDEPASATLARIAECESNGDPTAVSSTGKFRGKYQFTQGTWEDLGGTGDPAAAPEAEQDERAAALLAQRGTAPWPVCGRGL